MRFSLSWLLWLVACAAIGCALLMLPPLFTERVVATGSDMQGHHFAEYEYFEATHWPAEVTARLLLAGLLAIAPLLVKWRRRSGYTAS